MLRENKIKPVSLSVHLIWGRCIYYTPGSWRKLNDLAVFDSVETGDSPLFAPVDHQSSPQNPRSVASVPGAGSFAACNALHSDYVRTNIRVIHLSVGLWVAFGCKYCNEGSSCSV